MTVRLFLFLVLGLSVARADVRIASLNTVLSDLAREVGGTRVSVEDIVRPGTDPHIFEPSPGGHLYAGELGSDQASTYESMMRHNISTIVAALR